MCVRDKDRYFENALRKEVPGSMKKIFMSFIVLLSMGAAVYAAEKPLGVEEYTSIDQLATEIASYFPKVQGVVKAVKGDQLTIALGTKDGLLPGVELALWRDGKEIHHPVTGEVIGRVEVPVGSAEVLSLSETSSTAVVKDKVLDPKPGDKARITPKKISLAILPVRADRPEIIHGLADRLNELGRFTLLDSEKTADFLRGKKQRDESLIREMSKAFNLDVIAAVGIYPAEEGKIFVTTRLFYADEARPLDTIVAMIDLKKKKDVFGDVKPYFAPEKVEKSNITELPFEAQLFAAADLEGTGSLEYVLSDGSRLHIYRQSTAGWREEWVEPAGPRDIEIQHINLDVADINGDGRPEIFVTEMRNGTVVSPVFEFRGGQYQKVAEVPGFLRVVNFPGVGRILIGRDYDPKSFYTGPPRQYEWSNGKYVLGKEISLPEGIGIYGFVFANVGETSPLLVALTEKNRVVVYSKDTRIWMSAEEYPAVGITVTKPVTDAVSIISRTASEDEKSQKVRIPGRVLALDMNGDGKDEIIVVKNIGDSFLGSYSKAEIVSLGWTGARLEQRWAVNDVPGAIPDFQIVRQENGGADILALVKSSGGLFARDKYSVLTFQAK
jgi:hypothetical protein